MSSDASAADEREPPPRAAVPSATEADPEKLTADLEALKAKTAKWKSVVKAQLEEAAAKNERLRADLLAATKRADAAAAEVRLQLTAEFKERTSGKDHEIQSLEVKSRSLQERIRQLEMSHVQEVNRLASEHEAAKRDAVAAVERASDAKADQLKSIHAAETEKALRKFDALQAEHRSALKRIEELQAACEGLKKEAHLAATASAAATASTDDAATEQARALATARDERHSAEVASIKRQLTDAQVEIKTLQTRLAAESQRHEQGLQGMLEKREAQFRAEIARRDEQLHVTQAMLGQARDELTSTVTRVQRIHAESAAAVDAAERRAATLSAQLATKTMAVMELQTATADLRARCADLEKDLHEAQAEAQSREAAFNELFERDQHRDGAPDRYQTEADSAQEVLRARIDELETQLETQRAAAAEAQSTLASHDGEWRDKTKALQAKEQHLLDLERRVRENQMQLAREAQRLQHEQREGRGGKRRRPEPASSTVPSAAAAASGTTPPPSSLRG
jgi:chromosome segregation ATPase